jgi:hypothetical protein
MRPEARWNFECESCVLAPAEIVEHCLHHITGDDAEKAYKRGEALRKRRVVMQAFADFATRPPKKT